MQYQMPAVFAFTIGIGRVNRLRGLAAFGRYCLLDEMDGKIRHFDPAYVLDLNVELGAAVENLLPQLVHLPAVKERTHREKAGDVIRCLPYLDHRGGGVLFEGIVKGIFGILWCRKWGCHGRGWLL